MPRKPSPNAATRFLEFVGLFYQVVPVHGLRVPMQSMLILSPFIFSSRLSGDPGLLPVEQVNLLLDHSRSLRLKESSDTAASARMPRGCAATR